MSFLNVASMQMPPMLSSQADFADTVARSRKESRITDPHLTMGRRVLLSLKEFCHLKEVIRKKRILVAHRGGLYLSSGSEFRKMATSLPLDLMVASLKPVSSDISFCVHLGGRMVETA